ncbi:MULTISPECIES: YdgH/BhsA/McbA family protein [Franconibacter]|uniref:DUF1471 domain-containing protein n=1 Tax=Franconibacter TaxID=1649295 RepID=UPI001FF7370C|nr:DUF1471 domain-containing protein [Franconibacter daqui]MCK1968323.1 DUF1471 domain-containing protein [Franconibacter sp. IITDAS19]MEB5922448.1 DUF1471 domain-containing protein [Franconibacter daqui]
MKTVITLLLVYLLLPFSLYAHTVTATGGTLEEAESKIRQLAQNEKGASYKIIEARMGNKAHITAKITTS